MTDIGNAKLQGQRCNAVRENTFLRGSPDDDPELSSAFPRILQ
ncbi:MAG: hypothetical protein ACYCX0_01755 [Desulfurivibrionaceae bacterium]|jgi:hypothetical protein|nr:hypothetical protein [Desulfurivibrionaceae bacterium]MDP2756562.1 hypothetical protein [Desulfurivibrionaceae bacterium]